jgi:hypothetical protein
MPERYNRKLCSFPFELKVYHEPLILRGLLFGGQVSLRGQV